MSKTKKKKRFESSQNGEPIARYVSEGNPNIDKNIEKARMESSLDVQLVQEIQEAISKGTSIFEGSHHIQVTAHEGIITLTGNVLSEQEKMTVGDKAAAVAGFGKVNNQLQVAEKK